MKTRQVKDLMIPASEYIKISEDMRLPEAAAALKNAIIGYVEKNLLYDCVLVEDKNNKLTGKLSPVDVIKALEPKYSRTGDSDTFSKIGVPHFGLSPEYVKNIVSRYSLWDESLEDMLKHASNLKVKDFMYAPSDKGHLLEESTLADAIHQMALSHHASVLVFKGVEITGVISLKDIFKEVCAFIDLKQD